MQFIVDFMQVFKVGKPKPIKHFLIPIDIVSKVCSSPTYETSKRKILEFKNPKLFFSIFLSIHLSDCPLLLTNSFTVPSFRKLNPTGTSLLYQCCIAILVTVALIMFQRLGNIKF